MHAKSREPRLQLECIGSTNLPRALGCYERENRSDIRKGQPPNVILAAPVSRYIELSQVCHSLQRLVLLSPHFSLTDEPARRACVKSLTVLAFLPQTSANGSRVSMNITSPFARAAFEQSSAQVQLCYSDSYSDGAAISSPYIAWLAWRSVPVQVLTWTFPTSMGGTTTQRSLRFARWFVSRKFSIPFHLSDAPVLLYGSQWMRLRVRVSAARRCEPECEAVEAHWMNYTIDMEHWQRKTIYLGRKVSCVHLQSPTPPPFADPLEE